MPTFQLSTAVVEPNPFNLVDGVLPHHVDLTWYVARAATRQEAHAERSLTNARMAFYVPRLTRWGSRGRRKIRVRQALFEGYGFVGLARGQSFYDLPQLEGVHGVIRFGEAAQPRAANFGIISLILAAEVAGHFDRTIQMAQQAEFTAGEPIKVVEGGFRGFNASFVKMRPHDRVRVLLDIFGRKTEVELGIDDIRKLA